MSLPSPPTHCRRRDFELLQTSQTLTVPNTQKRHRKCLPQCIHSQLGEMQVPSRIQNQGDHFPKSNKLSLLCVTLLLKQRVSKLPKLFKKPKTCL